VLLRDKYNVMNEFEKELQEKKIKVTPYQKWRGRNLVSQPAQVPLPIKTTP
jgi:hypothetical protein